MPRPSRRLPRPSPPRDHPGPGRLRPPRSCERSRIDGTHTSPRETSMANYRAADITECGASTGAGMHDVKKALDEAEGDKAKAVELIRVKGLKGVAKREGRTASEGLIAVDVRDSEGGQTGTLVELNSETDFVAKNDKFVALGDEA